MATPYLHKCTWTSTFSWWTKRRASTRWRTDCSSSGSSLTSIPRVKCGWQLSSSKNWSTLKLFLAVNQNAYLIDTCSQFSRSCCSGVCVTQFDLQCVYICIVLLQITSALLPVWWSWCKRPTRKCPVWKSTSNNCHRPLFRPNHPSGRVSFLHHQTRVKKISWEIWKNTNFRQPKHKIDPVENNAEIMFQTHLLSYCNAIINVVKACLRLISSGHSDVHKVMSCH